jgi:hypothetical protein
VKRSEEISALNAHAERYRLALTDLLNNRVLWSSWHKIGAGHKCRAGMTNLPLRSYVIIQYRVHGQMDTVEVHEHDTYADDLQRRRRHTDNPELTCTIAAVSEARQIWKEKGPYGSKRAL